MKRCFSLLLALVLVVCCVSGLAFQVLAAESAVVDFSVTSTYNPSGTSKNFSQVFYNTFSNSWSSSDMFSILKNLPADAVLITSYSNRDDFFGIFLDSTGRYCFGHFNSVNYHGGLSVFGVKNKKDFILLQECPLICPATTFPVFVDEQSAKSYAIANSVGTCYFYDYSTFGFYYAIVSYAGKIIGTGETSNNNVFSVSGTLSSSVYFYTPSGISGTVFHTSYQTIAVVPSTPSLDTSFGDQVVYIAEDETFNLFVNAEDINGTPSIDWYAMQENEDGTWSSGEVMYTGDLQKYADGCYIGGWEYIPDADAAPYSIMFSAIVTNTVGELTASTQTGFVILHVTAYDDSGGSGTDPTIPDSGGDSPGDSETLGKLEEIETDIQKVKAAVAEVQETLDDVNDALHTTNPALDASNDKLQSDSDVLHTFEEDQLSSLNDNKNVITDAFNVFGEGSTLLASFRFISDIVDGTFDALGAYQIVITLPLALGLFLFLCSRVPGNMRPKKDGGPVAEDSYLADMNRMDGYSLHDSDRDKSPL